MNCSYFYDFLGLVLWALIFREAHFIRKKIVVPRISVCSQNKKIIIARPLDPTANKGDAGSLTIVAYDTGALISVSKQPVHGLLKIFHLYSL
jgi:hypothetical protein